MTSDPVVRIRSRLTAQSGTPIQEASHVGGERPPAEEILARHGFTWERLEKLANRALSDRMRKRGITLDPDRRQRALEHYINIGVAWADQYDETLARGVSFTTSCYRRMYPRLTDFLRKEHGDSRYGTPLHQVQAPIPDGPERMDQETFEQLAEQVSGGLTTRALNTLHTIGYDMFVLGLPRREIREVRGLEPGEIDELLEELGWQLRKATKETR